MTYSSPVTAEHKARYLNVLRATGNKSVAARAIGFAPGTMKRHREIDDAFDEDCQAALDEAADALEEAARIRAVDGILRQKSLAIGGGRNRIVEELQYSDTLLLALLKAKKPDEYADRSKNEISNPDGSLTQAIGDTELAAKLASLLALAEARMSEGNANG